MEKNGRKYPRRPEALYKNMAFSMQRPLMRRLGLLSSDRRPSLTERVKRLRRCSKIIAAGLTDLSTNERVRIRHLLGLDFRAITPKAYYAQTIRNTYEELRILLGSGIASEKILTDKHHSGTNNQPLHAQLAHVAERHRRKPLTGAVERNRKL
jgi:hypothetical protein